MKHKHAEVIKAWADGEQIQWAFANSNEWSEVKNNNPSWDNNLQYRVKPPALKWPETTMTDKEINQSIVTEDFQLVSRYATETGRRIANAAIAHACETGQLVLPDPERDMKIAIAAWKAGVDSVSSNDLESIIKEATK